MYNIFNINKLQYGTHKLINLTSIVITKRYLWVTTDIKFKSHSPDMFVNELKCNSELKSDYYIYWTNYLSTPPDNCSTRDESGSSLGLLHRNVGWGIPPVSLHWNIALLPSTTVCAVFGYNSTVGASRPKY